MVKALIIEDKPHISNHVDLAFKLGFPEVKLSSVNTYQGIAEMVTKEMPDLLILNSRNIDKFLSKLIRKLKNLKINPLILIIGEKGEVKTVIHYATKSNQESKDEGARADLLARIKTLLYEKTIGGG